LNGVPAGLMVIPKYQFIQDLRKEYSDEMAEGDYDKEYKAMRDIIHPPGHRTDKFSFLNEYGSVVSNTENMHSLVARCMLHTSVFSLVGAIAGINKESDTTNITNR
jgi:hypothetical protein